MSNNRRDYRKSSFVDGMALEMRIKEKDNKKLKTLHH